MECWLMITTNYNKLQEHQHIFICLQCPYNPKQLFSYSIIFSSY